jgi:pseudaminic acid synthase
MLIAGREIGPQARPYVIAEMSGNHNQSLARALQIVDAAAEAGADALKLQTYTPDTMTLDIRAPGFVIEDPASPWSGRQLYELYREAHTPWEWHRPIMERALAHGMHCFSTPFDETAVDFLESLDVPAYKIASFECTDLPLVRRVAATGKPMIISTGMATLAEIDETVRTAREAGCDDLVLLKCTSTYPATPVNSNIRSIPVLRDAFGCAVGLSDHTLGCGAAVAAVALGACVIEKHFTLARAEGGVDAAFSLEPLEFAQLRTETERAWQALGSPRFGTSQAEVASLRFRRSVYIVEDLKAGDVLTPRNLRTIRPGYGLPPRELPALLGCAVREDVARGTPASWSLVQRTDTRTRPATTLARAA